MPTPSADRRQGRYERIMAQLDELLAKSSDPVARMATCVALLHHKMPHFFWTGFYRRQGDNLVVGPYQGPLACAVLPAPDGVCWSCLQRGESILVKDVEAFAGHVACDARSRSEVVVPLRDAQGKITGVLDVDAEEPDAFSAVDATALQGIADLIYRA